MSIYVLTCPKFSWENVNRKAIQHAKKHHINRVLDYRLGRGRSPVSDLLALN